MTAVTDKLTRRADRLEHRFPDVCPKCGHPLSDRQSRLSHFERYHYDAIARATWVENPDFSRDFAYVGPVWGEPDRWLVMWLDWPIELVKMRHRQYVIEWRATVPPKEITG